MDRQIKNEHKPLYVRNQSRLSGALCRFYDTPRVSTGETAFFMEEVNV